MSPSGEIIVDRCHYHWKVQDQSDELFPWVARVLVIRSDNGATDFRVAVRPLNDRDVPHNDFWLGPAFVRAADPAVFPSLAVGCCYLFPAFKRALEGVIHGELVRSIVAGMSAGRRLTQVEPDGLTFRERAGMEAALRSVVRKSLWQQWTNWWRGLW